MNSTAADLVDVQLASGIKSGYAFTMACTPPAANGTTGYEVKTAPTGASITDSSCGTSSGRCFYTSYQGTVYIFNGTGSSDGSPYSLSPLS